MTRWVCPFCNRPQVYTDKNAYTGSALIWLGGPQNSISMVSKGYLCLNDECEKITLTTAAHRYAHNNDLKAGQFLQGWNLWPESASKPQPDYIPAPLRNDYYEACLIRDLSPKASATLSRRCLQGMIRDFCGISKSRLVDEINAVRKAIEDNSAPPGVLADTIDAIDSVRSVGNIGAHMEKDINVIVEVDTDEAQILISLIELLFQEWYVTREERKARLAKVTALSHSKKAELGQAQMAALPKPDAV